MQFVTQDGFIRPLLTTTREEVRNWATEHGISSREDSSNANLSFSRNRLREQTMPALARDFNSNLETGLARAAEVAQAEENYWFEQIEPVFQHLAQQTHFGLILDITQLTGLHVAVQRRVMRRAILEIRGDLRSIDIRHVDAILGIVRAATAMTG